VKANAGSVDPTVGAMEVMVIGVMNAVGRNTGNTNAKIGVNMKQVIVLRKDLKMRKGKMIAQGAHASMIVLLDYPKHEFVQEWLSGQFTKIAVSVDSEDELLELYEKAKEAKLPCSLVTDAGRTEFNGVATITSIAVGPGPIEEIDKITGNLKLL